MSKIPDLKTLALRDTAFADLMQKRIYSILLVATRYDSFILEDDGRVDEQIYNEYNALSLSSPPRITQVLTTEEALDLLRYRHFDLIICMPNMDHKDTFQEAEHIKNKYPSIPMVVLTPFSKEVSKRVATANMSVIDYIFSWLGNTELLIAIIKLLEDKMNAPVDTKSAGVQIILLVEDSIRFYSSALTHLYTFVLEQSQEFSKEALNNHLMHLRMRGRPKILLARDYEEAIDTFEQYKDHILGIVSDMSINREGKKDPLAGFRFGQHVKEAGRTIPFILESSDATNATYAEKLGAAFIEKSSKNFPQELRREVSARFGFGDFVIINPNSGDEIMRIKDLKDLQHKIYEIPDDSLVYHLSHDHFSRFFYSRAMFPPAEILKKIDVSDYENLNEARDLIFQLIVRYRKMKNFGTIAIYQRDRFDEYSNFARMGNGSLGGKGRGLAFMAGMIKRYPSLDTEKMNVNIPRTVVICTDIFDQFMENNNLYPIALQDVDDDIILDSFLKAELPDEIKENIAALTRVISGPIAVRSSSLLEDSHYQPFAGVYSTYMVPPINNKEEHIRAVSNAIKAVYASTFYQESKTYMLATSNLIDQEKMAVILQEAVGSEHNGRFYPNISGVARSLNFYPIGEERAEDGTCSLALGLGKYIVDGGRTLHFSPKHPHSILQMSTNDLALRETQTQFYGLDLSHTDRPFVVNDGYNLLKLNVKDAEQDGTLKFIASTFDPYDQTIRDGLYPGGRKIISFVNILQHNVFPLAETLDHLLSIGQKEMGRPIEIEFAVNIDMPNNHATFYLLQIRPIVDSKEVMNEDLSSIRQEDTLLYSSSVLGHGIMNDIHDVVYVKSDQFNNVNNQKIAYEIEKINRKFFDEGRNYILIGPGRWGSSDHFLGIPVKWANISNAGVITECGLKTYRIEPSQGTHFFQNMTSFGVGYFTINPYRGDGWFDEEFLNKHEAEWESPLLKWVHFENPLVVKMDGKKSLGVIMKPAHTE